MREQTQRFNYTVLGNHFYGKRKWNYLNVPEQSCEQTTMMQHVLTGVMLTQTCHGAGAAVGPAGATVLGDVLVAGRAHIVGAIDVPPVP